MPAWTVAPAVVFGLVPLWGWAGVDLPAYVDTLVVTAAVAAAGLVGLLAVPSVRRAATANRPR